MNVSAAAIVSLDALEMQVKGEGLDAVMFLNIWLPLLQIAAFLDLPLRHIAISFCPMDCYCLKLRITFVCERCSQFGAAHEPPPL